MMQLRCHHQLLASSSIFIIVVVIILTQLHLITSAPTSTASAPADDVTDRLTSPWQQNNRSDATERRQSVLSDEETTQGVRSNAAAASATINRLRRQLSASQGCGPVCNRCRQVRLLSAVMPSSALCGCSCS